MRRQLPLSVKFTHPPALLARRLLAVLLLTHLLAVMAMAASPGLHHWVHADADDDDHDCAVTLFLSGSCDAAPPSILALAAPLLTTEIPALPLVPAPWVASVFALNRVFEHGPPGWVSRRF